MRMVCFYVENGLAYEDLFTFTLKMGMQMRIFFRSVQKRAGI